jgi:nucleotide-binding universal stress UspA family protein
MMKKILVPTDGSDHAIKAIDLAADLAEKYGAEIVVLHVLLDHTSIYDLKLVAEKYGLGQDVLDGLDELMDASLEAAKAGYGGPVSLPAPRETHQAIGEAISDNFVQRAASMKVANVKKIVTSGSPADAILEAAEGEGADTIVMGSRGLGKIADMLMGSVSHKVSHHANCTCITVK